MASRQEDKSSEIVEESFIRFMRERTAIQTSRSRHAAEYAGDEIGRIAANTLKQDVEALQTAAWRFGLDITMAMMERPTDGYGRTLALFANEVEQATERLARNMEAILCSTAASTKIVSGISREYFEFARHQIEASTDRLNDLWCCRIPQELAVIHSNFVRGTIGRAF
jgi:hypothetical protein